MTNFIKNLISKRNGNEHEIALPKYANVTPSNEIEKGNIHEIGYITAGRHNGDPMAMKGSLESIKSGQIVDDNNNEQKRTERIESIDKEIGELKNEANGHKAGIEKIDQVELPRIEREIAENNLSIDEIRIDARTNKYERNRFNLVITWVGFVAGFFYLYLFYVSAIHSALFRNIAGEVANATTDNIGLLLNNVFNVTAFKEFNIHWIAPVVFFIFAAILHFALENRSKISRCISVITVLLFVLVADGLLAYYIEKNNYTLSKLMGLAEGQWVFYKSSGFYLVLFFGFFTSLGWSLILHKLAGEYESKNPERKAIEEIRGFEKKLRQLFFDKEVVNTNRLEKANIISALDDKIKSLENSKNNVNYSLVDFEKNVDDFYCGWLSYLNGLKSGNTTKQECEGIYISFKSENFKHSLTA